MVRSKCFVVSRIKELFTDDEIKEIGQTYGDIMNNPVSKVGFGLELKDGTKFRVIRAEDLFDVLVKKVEEDLKKYGTWLFKVSNRYFRKKLLQCSYGEGTLEQRIKDNRVDYEKYISEYVYKKGSIEEDMFEEGYTVLNSEVLKVFDTDVYEIKCWNQPCFIVFQV